MMKGNLDNGTFLVSPVKTLVAHEVIGYYFNASGNFVPELPAQTCPLVFIPFKSKLQIFMSCRDKYNLIAHSSIRYGFCKSVSTSRSTFRISNFLSS